jgi:hypothetical protein
VAGYLRLLVMDEIVTVTKAVIVTKSRHPQDHTTLQILTHSAWLKAEDFAVRAEVEIV